jgi:pyrimidine deaminase RibD-like protein/GNAT superfamily N-acetyltransferase
MNVFDLFGEDASGVVANRKQVNDPRYSMSLSPDVGPGEVRRQLKKYNLVEGEANTARLDAVLVDLCEGIIKHQRQDAGHYGLVAAAVVDPDHNVVYGINNLQSNGKRVHAERAALDNYKTKHGDIPEGSVIVTTLSPCTEPMKEREGISCSELIDTTPIRRVYAGYRDPTQDHLVHDDFDVVVTSNDKIQQLCKGFADCFLKETVNKELWHPERMFKQRVPIGDYEFDAIEKTGGMIDWDANALTIIAYDPRRKKNKQVIGKADFVVKGRGSKSRLVSDDTYVDPKYRGEGIATMMYAYARSLGNNVGHSNIRTPMGKAMWDKWGADAQHLMAEDDATGGKLVIFDIDDTLVNTNTKVIVQRDGKPVRQLNSQEFTHYKLQPGESFDFGAFSDAEEFARESKPIVPMIQQLNNDIASGNKVVMITARSDFDNRDTFLNAFRRWDVNIDRVHVYRAGNDRRPVSVDAKKADIVRKLLSSGGYTKAIMYDDSKPNLQSFVRLHSEHPNTRFYAWHVDHSGRATEYARTGIRQPRPMFEADAADKITDAVIDFYKQQDIKPQKVDDYVDHAVSLLHKADPGIRGRVRKILSKANENPYLQGGVITTVGALLTGGLLTTASQMHLTPAQTNILLQAVLNTVIPTLVSRVNGKNWIDTIKYTLASAGIGTGIALLSEDAKSDVDTIAQEFVEFVNSRLKFKQLPHIDFVDHVTGTEHPTFGSFDSTTDVISIGTSDRHAMDIMRTLAHELVHHKQRETKPQSQLDGGTASEDENQANSVAGTLMREFADQHPEYFGGEQLAEGLNEITWIKPNFDYEWDEIEFQAKQPQVPADVRNYMARHFPNKQAWMKSVQHGRPVVVSPDHGQKIRNYTDNKRDLLNALSPQSHDPQGPAKAKRVNALFDKGGPIEMPIILQTEKGLWLIGGKTRLGTANLLKGIPAKVWMIGGEQTVAEGLEQEYLSQIPNLTWKPVSRSVWNTIQDEGLDEEQDAPKHTDWVMASLSIDPKDAQALQAFDSDAIEDFNRFDIHLKSRYPGLTDLIDYDNGTVTIVKPIQMQDMAENFADGRNPGRKGLAKRSGVDTKASVSSLRKTAKNSSGEKQRMAHWMANMKAGRAKAQRK